MSSLFCCLREGQPVPSGPIPAHRCCGSGSPDTGKDRGDAEGALPDTVRSSLPGLCHDISCFGTGRNPAWMAWLFSHFAVQTALWLRPPFWGDVPLLHSSSVHSGECFPFLAFLGALQGPVEEGP